MSFLRAMVVFLGVMVLSESGCGQDTSCLNQLMPCLGYLNGTQDVASSCCDPLKRAIQSEPKCICYLISNQGANQAQQAGINITQAQELPARCGIRVDPLGCITGGGGSSSDVNNSGGVSLLPPVVFMIIGVHIIL